MHDIRQRRIQDGNAYHIPPPVVDNNFSYFRFQNEESFIPYEYGEGNYITIDQSNGLLYLHLQSFRSTVTVSNYSILLYKSGPRPSRDISIGGIYSCAGATFGLQGTWKTNGGIALTGNVNPDNRFIATNGTIIIPDGVTFR